MKTLRTTVLAGLALGAVLLGSGCVVTKDTADLDFDWNCSGARCSDVGVMTCVVELTGAEYYTTESGIAADGISLEDFTPGDYGFHIVGISPSRTVLYEKFGTFTAHRGSNRFNVTLLPPR